MKSFRFLVAAALGTLAISAHAQALKVGSPAPKVQFAKWIKGKQFDKLESKGIYVMEFWATWCGPCKVAMPHVTELAKKYPKITFTGVSIFEDQKDEKFLENVATFVKGNTKNMGYNVAADDTDQFMAKTWMDAAGLNAIPATFVVQDGKVAWIGHPMALDPVLEKMAAGNFNVDAEAKKAEEETAKGLRMRNAVGPINQAANGGDFPKAIDLADRALMANPEFRQELSMIKFQLMMISGDERMGPWAKELSTSLFKNDALALNQMAWSILDEEANIPHRDFPAALVVAERAVEASEGKDWMIVDTLALAQFKNNLFAKALENQRLAAKMMAKAKDVDDKTRKDVLARLERFEKAAKGG